MLARYCRFCGAARVSAQSQFCIRCGKPLQSGSTQTGQGGQNPWSRRALLGGAAAATVLAGKRFLTGREANDPAESSDRHALAAPPAVSSSLDALAAYLGQSGGAQWGVARAIFRWIGANIDYDVASLRRSTLPDGRAEAALKRRAAVCGGYANLFHALAQRCGLESVVVSGSGRGFGYRAGGTDRMESHAWNAVKIHEKWELLDCTWGAGHLNESQTGYERDFEPFYFLAPPEQFRYSHFPTDPKWQLCRDVMQLEEYQDLPYVAPIFFQSHLRLRSHAAARIIASPQLSVLLSAPQPLPLSAEVIGKNGREFDERTTLVQWERDGCRIRVHFPAEEIYLLRIYVQPPGQTAYRRALEYEVEVSGKTEPLVLFPRTYETFHRCNASLEEPLDALLTAGANQRFCVTVPGAERVAVLTNGHWTQLSKAGNVFGGSVRLRAGKVGVLAQFPSAVGEAGSGLSYEYLLEYQAE
jgi:hypothetical protein